MKQPRNPFHPGEILREDFLEPARMTQTALAAKLGWTRTRLYELIRGKRGITGDVLRQQETALPWHTAVEAAISQQSREDSVSLRSQAAARHTYR